MEDAEGQLVYRFGAARTDGRATMRDVLGGKGANLAEMARIGLPVPPGFTLATAVCRYLDEHDGAYPPALEAAVDEGLAEVEAAQGKRFGDAGNPLLVSVRSGARASMPGMMDTILNLGLNDETAAGLARHTGNPHFAADCYRRFIGMYGEVVLGVSGSGPLSPFAAKLETLRAEFGVEEGSELTAEQIEVVIAQFKALVAECTGAPFPQDPRAQLWGAIGAVFGSWRNERAVRYRQRYGIPRDWGTAVNVQAMVFGNGGAGSATGVAFTRDPASGERGLTGEYLANAQGEDVVAGTFTPTPLARLAQESPALHAELAAVADKLEAHFRDMQDFEFTIEAGRLFLLQTRDAKRAGPAAVRIAVEMHDEGLIDQTTALRSIPADSIDSLLAPSFDSQALSRAKLLARGLPAGPGAATGRLAFSSAAAAAAAEAGTPVVLCRSETSPDDLQGMLAADGILTARGGVSSHAALVARQLGKVCVCGAASLVVDEEQRTLSITGSDGDVLLREGDAVSLDGGTGAVYAGAVATSPSEVRRVLAGELAAEDSRWYRLYATVMGWADEHRPIAVRANADTPAAAAEALQFGAEGIGLCRTEHMFFDDERIDAMRRMILAADEAERRAALAKLLPFQRQDFRALFATMGERPVTIRLLDPPLHEFLPVDAEARRALAAKLGVPAALVDERVQALSEANPMLGCRGCRLGIVYPEITEMQARAIFEAAAAAQQAGVPPKLEVMVPLVGFREELADQATVVRRIAEAVMAETGERIAYQLGTMIEVPRAALTANEIAETAEFFSFGTNDLTQMTLGLSRDDMHGFYDGYVQKEIFAANPFAQLDEAGVGQLILEGVRRGRSARPDLKVGICGEHGGDPASIAFCQQAGLDYVSCSAPRVPVARLAAAQAALRNDEGER